MKIAKISGTLFTGLVVVLCFWTLALSETCEDLIGKQLGGAIITGATSITPPWTSPPSSLSAPTTVSVPFCRV